MVYETFLQTIKTQLEQQLGSSYTLTLRSITKNNGVILDGLCISRTGEKVAPTIYLNEYFPKVQEGASLDSILKLIMKLYRENTPIPSFDFNNLIDFSFIKDRIVFKLIHAESNAELLKSIPSIPYLDLAIVFYILLDTTKDGQMTSLIQNEHIELWKTDTLAIYEIAKKNTPKRLPATIKTMTEVMYEMAKISLGDDFKEEYMEDFMEEDINQIPLYVLSNPTGFYGASCMLYENVLNMFAETTGSNFIILPSSIHEILLIPTDSQSECLDFSEIVATINVNEVSTEDRLSNQVYYYSKEKDKIIIASASSETVETESP